MRWTSVRSVKPDLRVLARPENSRRQPRWVHSPQAGQALDVEPQQLFPDEREPTPAEVLAEHLGIE